MSWAERVAAAKGAVATLIADEKPVRSQDVRGIANRYADTTQEATDLERTLRTAVDSWGAWAK